MVRNWVQTELGWEDRPPISWQALSAAFIAGVDEAGRGPLAGPVYAAAVILDPDRPIPGLNDSKKLSEKARDALAPRIKEQALAWTVTQVSAEDIDRLNILQATLLAMQQAVAALARTPELVLVDGNRAPALSVPVQTVIGGDGLAPCISAASILAKTERDAALLVLHEHYPHYGFDRHKGYGTALHLAALEAHGPCPAHRRSFAPVRRWMKTP